MVKLSIIMPVYKVENYIEKSINSILSQKEQSFELILIDDGSPDNSGKICDEMGLKDSRIKVIHKSNEGAAIARNTAIPLASGEYLAFFDSDDWIESNMLYEMYNVAHNNDLDLLVSGFFIDTYTNVYTNEFFTLNYIPRDVIYHDRDTFRKEAYEFFDINMFYSPWNKIYKREYINKKNILFQNTYRDDFPFVLDVIKDISNIGFTSKQYYHFLRARSESETQKFVPTLYEKREEEHKWMKDLYKYWGLDKDKNSMDMLSRRYIDRVIECFVNYVNPLSKLTVDEIKNKIRNALLNKNLDEAFKYATPKKLYLSFMYKPLKCKDINMCYFEAKFIEFFKINFSKIFNKLKKNR